MGVRVVRYSERPELWEGVAELMADVWPEYNKHGTDLTPYWLRLEEEFPEWQLVLVDDESGEVLAEGNTIPVGWDGTDEGLGPGIDATLAEAFALKESGGKATAISALAAKIPPKNQGKGLAKPLMQAMSGLAREAGLTGLIAPVRPSRKDRYPTIPIERYVRWTREDGRPFDPWIRVHVALGARIGPAIPRSMLISGTVAEWESWTGMAFPETGDYVFPAGLTTVHIDRERDTAEYWEPNIWIIHPDPTAAS